MSSTVSPLVAQSISLYQGNLPATLTQMILAYLCIITNSLVLATILFNHELRRKTYFFFSASLAVAGLLVGVAYSYVTIRRLVVTLAGDGLVRSSTDCLWDVLPMTTVITSGEMQNMVVSVDRVLAVALPRRYPHFTWGYRLALPMIAWAYVVGEAVALVVTVPRNPLLPMCTTGGTYTNSFNLWITVSRSSWTAMSVGLCGVALIGAHLRLRSRVTPTSSKSTGTSSRGRSRELSATTFTISLIVLITFLTEATANIGYIAVNNYPSVVRSRYVTYLRIPQMTNYCLSFFVYLGRSQIFRCGFARVCPLPCLKRRWLQPWSTTGMTLNNGPATMKSLSLHDN